MIDWDNEDNYSPENDFFARNRQLAQRIKAQFEGHNLDLNTGQLLSGSLYSRKGEIEFDINLRSNPANQQFEGQEPWFEISIGGFAEVGTASPLVRISTRDGILSELVIAEDKLYNLSDNYICDEDGNMQHSVFAWPVDLKGESVENILINRFNFDPRRVSRITNVPELIDDEVPLNEFDYEKLDTTLKMIETGEIVVS